MEKRTPEGMKRKKEYIRQYSDQMYDRLAVRIPAGERAVFKREAEQRGMSLAGLVTSGVREYINNHPINQ